jgi:hypothetical protein
MTVDTQDWYKEWYRRTWVIYNSAWDRFLREYVFCSEPPFKIKTRPPRILGS